MELSFQRRLIAVFLAAIVANGVGLHVAMLPALAGSSAPEEAKTEKHSYFEKLHAGCVVGLKCSLCVFHVDDMATFSPAPGPREQGATQLLRPAPQDILAAAFTPRSNRIRAPPQASFPS